VTFLNDIKDYPWTSLLAGILPARLAARLPQRFQAPSSHIVTPGSVAGRALTLVIAIMTFLACLTAGGVYMVHQSASAWVDDIASEITIELNPLETTDIEKKMTLVSLFLAKQPGVSRVKPMSADDSAKLLEPWIGSTAALSALPVPRLIAVEIDRSDPPDIAAIQKALAENFEGVTLDDHRRWQSEIKLITRSTALGGLAVLALVAAATIAVIVSATRSVRAGLVGAVAAAITFLLLPLLVSLLGGGAVTEAETRRLLGSGELDIGGYLLLALIVVVIAALCMVTSRLGVFRVLKTYA
jgi:cell division transport system permease protein